MQVHSQLIMKVDEAFSANRHKVKHHLKVLAKSMRQNPELFESHHIDLQRLVDAELAEK